MNIFWGRKYEDKRMIKLELFFSTPPFLGSVKENNKY
jgi:hypothetical protein